MSKALGTIGTIAGVVAGVALIGTGIGAALGGTMILAGVGSASAIASVASAVSAVAMTGAQMTAKKPSATGSSSNVIIAANGPRPYPMGRTHIGGNGLLEKGYGGTVSGVPNPYKSWVLLWSGHGPIEGIEAFQADFQTISFSGTAAIGYYAGFMHLSTQLGACPEAAALSGPYGAIPGWGASHKLSGNCAGLWTLKFDKKAKRFASGVPAPGVILRGNLVYDPRQDSSYPGGSGACRVLEEPTYVGGAAAENPGCHGVTYALGRYQNGKKVFGCGFRPPSIDWPAWVEFANMCDANGWKIGGTIYEPGSRWDNLKRICAAGGGEPIFVGAKLSVRFNAPKVALDTIRLADLADGEIQIPAMKSWRDRKNGLIPKWRSEANKWEYVQSALVTVPEYVTQDRGEEKHEERQIDLCQWANQAAQLVAYELVNMRELGPIVLPLKPRFIEYQVGEALEIGDDLEAETGLAAGMIVTIIGRSIDPATAVVTLTLESETTTKHAFALGQTGTAPAAPTLIDPEDADGISYDSAHQAPVTVANEAAQLALSVPTGTQVVRSDLNQTYAYNGGTTGTMADWTLTAVTTGGNAASTPFTPSGGVAATNVQAAIVELDTEKAPKAAPTFSGAATITSAGASLTVHDTSNTAAATLTVKKGTAAGASELARLETFGSAAAGRGPVLSFHSPSGGASTLAGKVHGTANGLEFRGPADAVVATIGNSGLTSAGWLKTASYTVATLPSAATAGAGAKAYVTDATATTYASVVAGGGANKVSVHSDGAAWRIG